MGNYKDYADERRAVTRHMGQLSDFPEFLTAVKLCRKVIPLTTGHTPGTPQGSWSDQLFRAASSVPANVSEGCGRMQTTQQIQFLRYARGSAFEVVSHLLCCPLDLDTAELRREYADLVHALDASLTRLIDGDPLEAL